MVDVIIHSLEEPTTARAYKMDAEVGELCYVEWFDQNGNLIKEEAIILEIL